MYQRDGIISRKHPFTRRLCHLRLWKCALFFFLPLALAPTLRNITPLCKKLIKHKTVHLFHKRQCPFTRKSEQYTRCPLGTFRSSVSINKRLPALTLIIRKRSTLFLRKSFSHISSENVDHGLPPDFAHIQPGSWSNRGVRLLICGSSHR